MDHNPCPIRIQEDRGPLCIETTQATLKDLQEHTEPPPLVEQEEDKNPKSSLPPNLASHEEDNMQEEGNFLPLCLASFDFLKQMLKLSNQAQKMEVRDGVMELFKMNDKGGEQTISILHPSSSSYEHINESYSSIWQGYYYLSDE